MKKKNKIIGFIEDIIDSIFINDWYWWISKGVIERGDEMNILFICKNNRFRSKIAEAYLKKINKNVKVKSAGIIKGAPITKFQKSIVKEFGINIRGNPQKLSKKLLMWQDILVIVADDISISLFDKEYEKQIIVWKIPDVFNKNKKELRRTISLIMKRVNKLNKMLR